MLKLVFFVFGIYVCFLTWGITQERVSTTLYDNKKFNYFVVLNAFQALSATIVAFVYLLIEGKSITQKLSVPLLFEYLKISILSCIAPNFGYASLKHIDYPTLILGKTSKLVPVVLMNFVLHGKIFPLKKYLVVAMVTIGVSLFMLWHPKDAKSSSDSSLYGLGLLSINLLLDGAYNSSQDQVFLKYKIRGNEMMFWMNLFSFMLMSLFLLLNPYSTELVDAIVFCTRHPSVIYDIILFGITGALGQIFIFLTLHSFGSLVLVTVTVTRKMFSILLSVLYFGHELTLGQWASVGLVFGAIGFEALGKATPTTKDKKE